MLEPGRVVLVKYAPNSHEVGFITHVESHGFTMRLGVPTRGNGESEITGGTFGGNTKYVAWTTVETAETLDFFTAQADGPIDKPEFDQMKEWLERQFAITVFTPMWTLH